ncbi:hypothetical protein SAMN05444483_11440 [Salegentibacter echinorum]|uniref:HTH luxR-type domain-containing protein n=1 Tax=Salegentibacter echinorum TaxID=1073325 RepID=A0A1M5KE15_SALEC|nr:hypothetical protein [Salegentibacter echinorum]SHG50997.1 hypothetical protein SAMN05444483_11440 [Salegentibacter echinorum]
MKFLYYLIFLFIFFKKNDLAAGNITLNERKPFPVSLTDESVSNLLEKAQVFIDKGEYDKSTIYLNTIAKRYKGNNIEIETRVLGALARNYLHIGLERKALIYWNDALGLIKGLPNEKYFAAIFQNDMAKAFLKIKKPEKARECLEKALTAYPLPQTYQKLSKLAIDTKSNYELAKYYLDSGLKLIQNKYRSDSYTMKVNNNPEGNLAYAMILEGYAYYYLKNGDLKTSLRKYTEALHLTRILERKNLRTRIIKKIGYLHLTLGKVKESNNFMADSVALNDSLNVKKSKILDIEFEDVNKTDYGKKDNNGVYLTIISFVLIIVILTTYIVFKYYKWQRRRKSLKKKNAALRARLNKNFDSLIKLAKTGDSSFLAKFKQVYPILYAKLDSREKALTDSEIILCAMIWLKFSTKEIAQYTFVQHKTVQIKKYRLRKKLSLSKNTDLYKWICEL